MSVLATLLTWLVRLYQFFLRPALGTNCRFQPSCSDYALAALRTHGGFRGSALAAGRVLRCNPFCQGGHDPVPPHGQARLVCRPIPPEAV